jgi:hypothetical protein
MNGQMSERAVAALHDRILNLACNVFGLSAEAGARLVAEARSAIERNEYSPNSKAAIARAVAATREQLSAPPQED